MDYANLQQFLDQGQAVLAKGPVALIFNEDGIELESTLRHTVRLGFKALVLLGDPADEIPGDLSREIHRINYDVRADAAIQNAVNAVIEAAPGQWFYYCYNAEYLFYPFSETRSVGELLTFHTEERRDAMLTYVIDLYATDFTRFPNAVSLTEAHLDRSGYYALGRPSRDNPDHNMERQLNFHGGLRWRYEEHIPPERRKIDRVGLFRAQPGLRLRHDHTFNEEEYNTYVCPWHNNLTASIASFRTAKALKRNPGSTFDIQSFEWHNSVPFEWHSRQLLDLGLMEPGQWF